VLEAMLVLSKLGFPCTHVHSGNILIDTYAASSRARSQI
jgi:hypothetical protein